MVNQMNFLATKILSKVKQLVEKTSYPLHALQGKYVIQRLLFKNNFSKAISIGYLLSETFSPDNFKEKYVIHHFLL